MFPPLTDIYMIKKLTLNGLIEINYCFVFIFPAGIYLFKVNNGNIRTMYKNCSKLTIKATGQVIDVVLVHLLLALNRFHTFFSCSYS